MQEMMEIYEQIRYRPIKKHRKMVDLKPTV